MIIYALPWLLAASIIGACALEEEHYAPLGDKVSHPSAMTQDGKHFYVVNSDMEREHNAGSILTLDRKGNKIGVISTPRLGRFIVYRHPFIFVGHSATNQFKTPPQLVIYDARQPRQLKVHKRFELTCMPTAAVAPSSYNYFAVSCEDGKLHVGYFVQSAQGSLPEVKLRLVRDYGPHARRAMYIDTKNHHLYAFSTDWQRSDFEDVVLADHLSYATTPQDPEIDTPVDFKGVVSSRSAVPLYEVKDPNEIPDAWEGLQQLNEAEQHSVWSEYQVAILNLSELAENKFEFESRYSDQSLAEFRWLYFHERDSSVKVPKGYRYYRSNFWQVSPDPQQSGQFYISQRGVQSGARNGDVNAIYKVKITGSPFWDKSGDHSSDGHSAGEPAPAQDLHPHTDEFLKFTKVWGHDSQSTIYGRGIRDADHSVGPFTNSAIRFTGNFQILQAFKSRFFLVNDFRDPSLFSNNAYSLTLAPVQAGGDEDLMVFTDRMRSYFAISAIEDVVLAGTFYTHTLSLFAVTQDHKLKFIKDIH